MAEKPADNRLHHLGSELLAINVVDYEEEVCGDAREYLLQMFRGRGEVS